MSKLVDIKKLITLKNYSEKYGITKRKIYRYIDSNIIDFVNIDGIPFLYDKVYNELKTDRRVKINNNNVKILTKQDSNDKILTLENNKKWLESDLNQENNNVKILTKQDINVKILTLKEKDLLGKSDKNLSLQELREKQNLIKKIKNYDLPST